MKIVFFGSSKHVLPVIEVLNKDFDLCLIITTEKDPTDAVPSYAAKNNVPYLSVNSLKDETILEKIRAEKATVAVLGYFGLIVPQELLDVFPKGIVNIHPSLLPIYRGPTPVQTAIINGDRQTGTTIIILDKEVDHGPILAQKKIDIDPEDTTDSLHSKLFKLGAELIKNVLPRYLEGSLSPTEQDHNATTLTSSLSKSAGQFDVNNPPDKDKLNRMIRAYFPWPSAWTKININGKEKIVKFLPARNASASVAGGPENKLQVEGGKPMSVKDFLNGYPDMLEIIEKIF